MNRARVLARLNPVKVLRRLNPAKVLAKLSPAKFLVNQFLPRSPATLLGFGIAISLVDFAALYLAAVREGVLYISGGIGLLNNYGLFSTIVGNAISLYVAKKYYEGVCAIETSKAIIDTGPIKPALTTLGDMVTMQGKYRFRMYPLVALGALGWASNLGLHLFANPEVWWGHKVFDSRDHLLTFGANRVHGLYTFVFIMPLVGYVLICSSIQLRSAIAMASEKGALAYDLLNPDQRGGFAFVDRIHVAFNIVLALIYIQTTMHIETFERMNPEHFVGYVLLTVLLIGGNRMFLGDIYAKIKRLRLESLNRMKDKVYEDNKLSFEILKYCYERRISVASIVNFVIKAGAVITGIVKLWPDIARLFSRA
jgi:hypothetical protein